MIRLEIDPADGAHAASALSNTELDYLYRIVALELAVRMSRDQFLELLQHLGEARVRDDEVIGQVRVERDRILFVASVESDLTSLPLTTDERESHGQTYGMYL
ncbi:MAG TPA: hypothetical protein VI141_10080 [Acidimicrobiia bacterium]